MAIKFVPAVLADVKLIVGNAGGTGSGKTCTDLRLATGLSGGKRFAVIDTEAGRAKHYARRFAFDHCDIQAPFRPQTYEEAILAADAAGYPVIVVDSFSHEWAGEGGILDWQEEELDRMAGDNWQKRESCKMAAWIKPKMAHKKMVQRLLQIRAHLILSFRAEEKVEMIREDGKMKIVPKVTRTGLDGWIPICEKSLPYELTCSFLLTADAPGIPKPIKLEEQHRAFFPLDRQIDEKCGERLAEWAAGTKIDERPPYDLDTALKSYESVSTQPDFEALQKARGEIWRSIPKSAAKEKLAAAAEAAGKRIAAQQMGESTGEPSAEGPI
jgi:hypothetical protein